MAVDLTLIENQMVTAQALNNLILVWPQQQTGIQPQTPIFNKEVEQGAAEKFLFHYEGEQRVTLESDITDHVVENNSVINDQIALKPEIISTQGFIGELNNVVPEALLPLKIAAEKLTIINAYTPPLSVTAQRTFNTAMQAAQAAEILSKTKIPSFGDVGGGVTEISGSESAAEFAASVNEVTQNKQQLAFQKFYGYWRARTLFTVQTPWAIFKNCAILRINAIQPEDTQMISEFNIEFKVIRFAATRRTGPTGYYVDDFQQRAWSQGVQEEDGGMQAVQHVDGFLQTAVP